MKPASTHNRFVSLTINGVAAVQRIGYSVALTAATIVLGFLSPPILKSTGEINYPDRPVEELIPVKLVPIPCPSQMLPQNCVAHGDHYLLGESPQCLPTIHLNDLGHTKVCREGENW